MVRVSFAFNLKVERNKLIHQDRFPTMEELCRKEEEYQRELKKKLEPTETLEGMDIKTISKKVRKDTRRHNTKLMRNAIETQI